MNKKLILPVALVALVAVSAIGISSILPKQQAALAASGPCTVPSPSYGVVQQTVSVPVAGSYKIWARMSAPERSKDTYLLDINGTQCLTMGGGTVPLYSAGATTHFANNASNWISRTPAGATTTLSLTAGNHTFKSIGNSPGVVLDRIILTQDTNCIPTGTGENCASPPDTTAPTVRITSPANNATVSSTTNIVANATDNVNVTKVEFYQNGTLRGTDTTADANKNYSYSFNPSGATAGNHTFTAKAYDAAGNITTSSAVILKVTDTTAPTVSIAAPAANATVSGTTTVGANASDNVGVTRVEFFVNGTSKGSVSTGTSGRFNMSLATSSIANGTHSITARAYDAAGNSRTSTAVSFKINNVQVPPADTTAPTVSITAPTSGAIIRGTYKVSAAAADTSGISQVRFYVDGTLRHTDNSAPYEFSLDTTSLSNASHTFRAEAVDNSSNKNMKASSTITATVNNSQSPLSGDVNGDGVVDIRDFSLLKGLFSKTGTSAGSADINGDGVVDIRDFSILRGNFGKRA